MAYIQVSQDPTKDWRNGYLITTVKGLAYTTKVFLLQFFGFEKTVTKQWPEEEPDYSSRFKGKHFLTTRPDGRVRCTACFLCATNCPAQCIKIVAGETAEQGIEKYPVRFEIDILRCVFCGYCEEACPVDAIRLGPEYTMAGLAEDKWVYTLDHLLSRPAVKQKVGAAQVSRKPENAKISELGHH